MRSLGDSGGPLVCEKENNPGQFFLYGISITAYDATATNRKKSVCGDGKTVSAFTRVSFYVVDDWISDAMGKAANASAILTRSECPGVSCKSNGRCAVALDGNVDCLNGEDELKLN
jgi:secreted trypsin-like serine protease